MSTSQPFTTDMCMRLVELVKQKKDALFPINHTKEFTKILNDAWADVTADLNVNVLQEKTIAQVKCKWKNLKAKATKYSSLKRK